MKNRHFLIAAVPLSLRAVAAMEESYRKRREGSRASTRDPIVYRVAAGEGACVVRTETRLFCVGGN